MAKFTHPLYKTVTQGDDRVITLVFDTTVSDWSFFYTAKKKTSDSDEDAFIKVDPADVVLSDRGTVGYINTAQIWLLSASTNIEPGIYQHDIKVIKGSGGKNTLFSGELTIIGSNTKRNA